MGREENKTSQKIPDQKTDLQKQTYFKMRSVLCTEHADGNEKKGEMGLGIIDARLNVGLDEFT